MSDPAEALLVAAEIGGCGEPLRADPRLPVVEVVGGKQLLERLLRAGGPLPRPPGHHAGLVFAVAAPGRYKDRDLRRILADDIGPEVAGFPVGGFVEELLLTAHEGEAEVVQAVAADFV